MDEEYSMFGGDSGSTDWVSEITNNAGSGDVGFGWKYFSDGTAISPEGIYYQGGQQIYDPSNPSGTGGSLWDSVVSGAAGVLPGALKSLLSDPTKAAGIAGALLGGLGGNASWAQPKVEKVGYQGGIPSYTAVREAVPQTYDPTRRPGSRGQEYFTQQQFVSPTDTATAQATASQQATEASARNKAREAEYKAAQTQNYAMGGLASFAKGTYLNGSTDGMTDEIPATIDGKQPAKLSHGEFVLPADVVSHLGNGNSEAGAKRLYDMMDRIRKARTGTKQQGKQINPNKFMPG